MVGPAGECAMNALQLRSSQGRGRDGFLQARKRSNLVNDDAEFHIRYLKDQHPELKTTPRTSRLLCSKYLWHDKEASETSERSMAWHCQPGSRNPVP